MKDGKTLVDFYEGFVPRHIRDAGEDFIIISFEKQGKQKITMKHVVEYYKAPLPMNTGLAYLGKAFGDLRQIDNLAKECLEWFKHVNLDGLKQEAEKQGLILEEDEY